MRKLAAKQAQHWLSRCQACDRADLPGFQQGGESSTEHASASKLLSSADRSRKASEIQG